MQLAFFMATMIPVRIPILYVSEMGPAWVPIFYNVCIALEMSNEVALFKLDGYKYVTSSKDSKQQVRNSHRRRSPKAIRKPRYKG